VVLAAVGRLVSPDRRSLAFGFTTAIGSFGQFAMVPLGQSFLEAYGWSTALLLLAACLLVMMPLAAGLAKRRTESVVPERTAQNVGAALREAAGHAGYRYLMAGFFVCGFQVTFIAVHLPAYLVDAGIDASIGAWALSLVGLFNVAGSLLCGYLGGRYSKKNVLSMLYLGRALVITVFLILPVSVTSTLLFASVMGVLWLGTVPLTSGLVAQIFGMRHMGTLFGVVFLGHQMGSFTGVWLGGYLYDATGTYDVVWWIAIALGVAAAILHWPIDERSVDRPIPAAAVEHA
jgi:predicted MFS family arabinose efflux permease